MLKLRQTLHATAAALLFTLAGAPAAQAQEQKKTDKPPEDVNVVNTVAVRDARQTALAFRAVGMRFSELHTLGDVDVSQYGQIRVVVLSDFGNDNFPLTVSVVEGGEVVGTLDVIDVPGCPRGGGDCPGSFPDPFSISRVYDVPGRAIRFRATTTGFGTVLVFGR